MGIDPHGSNTVAMPDLSCTRAVAESAVVLDVEGAGFGAKP